MCNIDVREKIKKSGLRYYEIAKLMKISESTFGRLLRFELEQKEKDKIYSLLENNIKEE